ncbi:MAG: TRAP transporter substrate-binding protein DctP [Dehalococcoidia bacterium]|nr:TRAP transporter substrate-binding protein DctP [Dehalococcoidia bacterium]
MRRNVWLVCLSTVLLVSLIVVGCAKAPAPGEPGAPTIGEEPIKLRFAMWAPESSPNVWHTVIPWKETIEERTQGRVEVSVFTFGGLGPMEELYENCQAGVCDLFEFGIMSQFKFTQMVGMSYLFPTATVASVVINELAPKYLAEYDYPDVKILWMLSNSPADAICSTERCGLIKTLEDRKGKKTFAISPLSVKNTKAIGASPVSVPLVECYSALERGMLDYWTSNKDAVWVFKICYATKYRTITPRGSGTFTMGVMMNQAKFDSLPPDIQQIIEEESGEKWAAISGRGMELADRLAWEKVLEYDEKVGNPPVYYMTEEEQLKGVEIADAMNEEFIDELQAEGYPAREAMEELLRLVEVYTEKYPPLE